MTDAAELVKLADELPTRLRGLVEDCQSVAVSDALEDAADEIERLRAALAAQQDGAWQDIDTAPRDGTRILLHQKGKGAFEGWWHDDWPHAEHYWMDDQDSEPDPSHWRPLLAPPTT